MLDLFPNRRVGLSLRALLLSQVAAAALLSAGGKAMAQTPTIQTLPSSPSGIEAITPGVTSVYAVPLSDILPTQINLGDAEVSKKASAWNLVPASQLESTLQGDIEPVVIGPGGSLYLTDGHHTFASLLNSIYGASNPTVYVNVIANYSSDTPAQFVSAMASNGYLYPVNDGVVQTVNPSSGSVSPPIASSLADMNNDPYRGLEYSVLKNKATVTETTSAGKLVLGGVGLDKTGDDFSDFIWGNAYRNANNGLGIAYASPSDALAAALFSENGSAQTAIVGVTSPTSTGTMTNVTVGQLPGFILQNSITLTGQITNGTLAGGALSGTTATSTSSITNGNNAVFNGVNGLYLNEGGTTVTLEPTQPGFVMQLGSLSSISTKSGTLDAAGTSVTLTNGANSYTGGTFIAAGNLVTAINVGANNNGDALGAAATGGTIDLSNGNLNVQSSVQSENGIVFNSLSEGAGTLTFGTNTSGGTSFGENRNFAIGSETAIINTNGNTVTLTGQIASSNLGESGFAGLQLADSATNPGTLILAPTAAAGNTGFFGNIIISTGTLSAGNDLALGNNNAANGPVSAIDLDGGTFQAGGNLNSSERSVFLTGGSTLDVNGFSLSFGSLSDTQRTLTIANSGGSTGTASGSVDFGSSQFAATATVLFTGSNATSVNLGAITREGNATLLLTPYTGALGTTDQVFATSVTLTNGIVSPWIITDNGSKPSSGVSAYDFVTYGSDGFTVASYTSTFGSSNVVKASGTVSLSSGGAAYALNVQDSGTVSVGSGMTLTIGDGTDPAGLIMNGSTATIKGGTVAFGSSEAVISVRGNNTISSSITGSNGLTLDGNGSLNLSAGNVTGAITIDSGSLLLTSGSVLANSSGIMLMDNKSNPSPAGLSLGGTDVSYTFSALNSAGSNSSITLTGGSTLTVDTSTGTTSTLSSNIVEVSGAPSGGASITKVGGGLLDLSGASGSSISLTGSTAFNVTGGDLRIASNTLASATTGNITVGSGTELQFNQGGDGSEGFTNAITGQGDVRLLGGTLVLTGTSNTYSGGTYVEYGGTLDTSTGSLPTGGNIYSSGTVVFDQTTSGIFSGTIANGQGSPLGMIGTTNPGGTFVLDEAAGNSVTFTEQQQYTGSTTIESGTLTLGAVNTIASSSSVDLGLVGGGATASLSLGAANTVNGLNSEQNDTTNVALNGYALTIDENGAGQQSTYRGTITDTGNGAVILTGGGTLNLVGTTGSSAANTIAGSLTVTGGSTLGVTGNVSFGGNVTVASGALKSDPAEMTFSGSLMISPNGYLQAAAGDIYNVEGSFLNSSTNSLWNTSGATLEFSGGGTHTLDLTTGDVGDLGPAEDQPFAWGELDIATGSDDVYLSSGLSDGSVAFYVGAIVDPGIDLANDTVTNIFGDGFDIYYDPYLAANEYLDGGTYQLEDGGELIAAVPEPGSLSAMLWGLFGLGWLRRRRKMKKSPHVAGLSRVRSAKQPSRTR